MLASAMRTFQMSRKLRRRRHFLPAPWFTRGMGSARAHSTKDVVFYERRWRSLGKKLEQAEWLAAITGIDVGALAGMRRDSFDPESIAGIDPDGASWNTRPGRSCIAKRMSWASHRETTRIDKTAYCLLGISNINMPLLYGE